MVPRHPLRLTCSGIVNSRPPPAWLAQVYLAYSRTHNAEVALKIVNLDEASCNLVRRHLTIQFQARLAIASVSARSNCH